MRYIILLLFFLIIFINKSSIGQKNNILDKTKEQIKLTEARQLFFQGKLMFLMKSQENLRNTKGKLKENNGKTTRNLRNTTGKPQENHGF